MTKAAAPWTFRGLSRSAKSSTALSWGPETPISIPSQMERCIRTRPDACPGPRSVHRSKPAGCTVQLFPSSAPGGGHLFVSFLLFPHTFFRDRALNRASKQASTKAGEAGIFLAFTPALMMSLLSVIVVVVVDGQAAQYGRGWGVDGFSKERQGRYDITFFLLFFSLSFWGRVLTMWDDVGRKKFSFLSILSLLLLDWMGCWIGMLDCTTGYG
ncbi:hypothetical protein BC567DRAFT_19982 [Phyllosticta citribraziliensis]